MLSLLTTPAFSPLEILPLLVLIAILYGLILRVR